MAEPKEPQENPADEGKTVLANTADQTVIVAASDTDTLPPLPEGKEPDNETLIKQMASGLAYAHENGLVHSDFKPQPIKGIKRHQWRAIAGAIALERADRTPTAEQIPQGVLRHQSAQPDSHGDGVGAGAGLGLFCLGSEQARGPSGALRGAASAGPERISRKN